MNTEFHKQLAVCHHYRQKCDFWQRIMWWAIVGQFIGLFIPCCGIIGIILFIVWLVAFIPACVRLYQYARAVNKLGKGE